MAGALRAAGHSVELLPLTTTGDRWSASGTGEAPDRGLFVKELEEALLDGRAHLAVHSAKDLPADLPAALAVLAVPGRDDPRDVVVGPPGGLAALPAGARVATGSPRRAAQVLAAHPELEIVPIRGNVGTRLEKLARGDAEALVLAAAGLRRLGLWPEGATPLPAEAFTPAPGQGLLAVEGRSGDAAVADAAATLDDPIAHACLRAERSFLAAVGGGCLAPVGALCAPFGGGLRMMAFVGAADGGRVDRAERDGATSDPEGLGRELAAAVSAVRR